MPDGDGYELKAQIQKLSEKLHFHLPVAAFTGHTDKQELERIQRAGFDDYIEKPVKLDRLIESIKKMQENP